MTSSSKQDNKKNSYKPLTSADVIFDKAVDYILKAILRLLKSIFSVESNPSSHHRNSIDREELYSNSTRSTNIPQQRNRHTRSAAANHSRGGSQYRVNKYGEVYKS